MNSKSILLSSDGLKNIIIGENDFLFKFGEYEIKMNSILAEFISPFVSQLHRSDKTINSIHFEIPEKIGYFQFKDICTEETISIIHQISTGSSISINEEQSINLRLIAILFGNEELFNQINNLYPLEFNYQNIESYLKYVNIFSYFSYIYEKFDFSHFVEVISQNFYLIDQNKLIGLPKSILYMILSNKKLKLNNEDSLFEFINSIFSNNNDDSVEIISFYELIQIQNLTDKCFSKLLLRINANDINSTLWQNIRERFCVSNEKSLLQKTSSSRYGSIFYDGNESNSFHGIINKFTEEIGGNVDEKGIISVIPSTNSNSGHYRNVTDLNNLESFYWSMNCSNQWIKYDFKDKKIHPTHYSIRSCPSNWSGHEPCNWVIEGSNDDVNWKQLDSQNGVNCLYGASKFSTFKIQEKLEPNEFYRYIRMRMTKQNHSKTYNLSLSALEYFGVIIFL